MTFLQQGGARWLKIIRQFVALLYLPAFLVSQMLQERGVRVKMAFIDSEAVLVGNKPLATDDYMRISTGERCGFGASAP